MAPIATYVFLVTGTTPIRLEEDRPVVEYLTKLNMRVLQRTQILEPVEAGLAQSEELDMQFSLENDDYPSDKPLFDTHICDQINNFLDRQIRPLCLIAHDGHRFHYRVLKTEFERVGSSLPEDIMCACSLRGFFEILEIQVNISDAEPVPRPYNDLVHNPYYEPYPYPTVGYNLFELYKREFEDDEETHTSEVRLNKVEQLAVKYGQRFVKWVDQNHCYFSEVPAFILN